GGCGGDRKALPRGGREIEVTGSEPRKAVAAGVLDAPAGDGHVIGAVSGEIESWIDRDRGAARYNGAVAIIGCADRDRADVAGPIADHDVATAELNILIKGEDNIAGGRHVNCFIGRRGRDKRRRCDVAARRIARNYEVVDTDPLVV